MEKKKDIKEEPKDLWAQQLVKPISIRQYSKEIAETEKIIAYGESNSGKTSFYISILGELSKQKIPKEDILMCIIFPDRPTGLTKLMKAIPPEYLDCVMVYPINSYEELVSSTAQADKELTEHKKKTGKYGWIVIELLESSWKDVQDYYCRLAYGESLGEYFAKKRADVKAMKEDTTAYKSLDGWGDWTIIKYFHNYNWIDKIKRMHWNIVFTAELKEEGNKDSIFFDLGYRPAGEKDNIHRVDTVLYLSHKGNQFKMRPYKITGYDRLYGELDITGKNAYSVHLDALKRLEELGYKTSKMKDIETQAGITPPKPKPAPKVEQVKPKEEQPEQVQKPKEEKPKTESKEEDIWEL